MIGAAVLVTSIALGRYRTQVTSPDAAPATAPAPPTPADELRDLRAAVNAATEDRDAVRRRVIDFRSRYVGTPHATGAAGLLRRLPSPLDRLHADGSPFVRIAGLGPAVGGLAFTGDDSRLVIARVGRPPEELSLPELAPTARFPVAELAHHAPALTPDGRVAAGADSAGRLVVWIGGGVRVLDLPGPKAHLVGLAADGKTAVVVPADPDAFLTRVEATTGRILGHLDVRAVGVRDVSLAGDGNSCLLTADDGAARVVSLAGGQSVRAVEPFPNVPGPPVGVFAPDSGRLYLAGIEHMPGRYPPGADRSDLRYELPSEARPVFWWVGARFPRVTALAVSADEAAVAAGTGTGRVVVFAAATGKVTGDFPLPGGIKSLAFSTHGRVLAAAMDGGRVVLIPLGK
jgi:hypothetical protein